MKFVATSDFRLTGAMRQIVTVEKGGEDTHPDQIDKGARLSIGDDKHSMDQLAKQDKPAMQLITLLNASGRLVDAARQTQEVAQIDAEVKAEKARAVAAKRHQDAYAKALFTAPAVA